jgi:hypothetical protein
MGVGYHLLIEPLIALVEEVLDAGMANGRDVEFSRERITEKM